MQRDMYAGLFKKRDVYRLAVSILQLDGRVTRELVHDEVFRGYRSRRIVLMTNFAGARRAMEPFAVSSPYSSSPALAHTLAPAVPANDVIVPSFEALRAIHQPHYQYQLLPLLCADVETFAALQAICCSAGSPFRIQDRVDPTPLAYRFHNLPVTNLSTPSVSRASPGSEFSAASAKGSLPSPGLAARELVHQFFASYMTDAEKQQPPGVRKMPIAGVAFQGLLWRHARLGPTSAGAAAAAETPACGWQQAAGESPALATTAAATATAAAAAGPCAGVVAGEAESTRPVPRTGSGKLVSAAVLVTTHDTLNESVLIKRALMRDFFASSIYYTTVGQTSLSFQLRHTTRQTHVLAVQSPVGATVTAAGTTFAPTLRNSLLRVAEEKGLAVYEKVSEGQYRYATRSS